MPKQLLQERAKHNVECGSYVAVMVESKIYIAFVSDVNEDEGEAELTLMTPPIPAKVFEWSESTLGYIAPIFDIICSVNLKERDDMRFEIETGTLLALKIMGKEKKKKNLRQVS